MENLLADTNWLIRLEAELRRPGEGPALRLLARSRVHVNAVSLAEFISRGDTLGRRRLLGRCHKLPALDYVDAERVGRLRRERSKRGKPLGTPDAFMAASALRHGLRLVTADKDFSGIPGLRWSAYQT